MCIRDRGNAAEVAALEKVKAAQAQAAESAEALAVMLGDKPIEEGLV